MALGGVGQAAASTVKRKVAASVKAAEAKAIGRNHLLSPDAISREALRILHEKLKFHDLMGGEKGWPNEGKLRIRMPTKYKITKHNE